MFGFVWVDMIPLTSVWVEVILGWCGYHVYRPHWELDEELCSRQ